MRESTTTEPAPSVGVTAFVAGTRARVRWGVRRAAAEREKGGSRLAGLVAIGLGTGGVVFGITFAGGRYLRDNDALTVVHGAMAFGLLGLGVAVLISSIGHAATSFFAAQDLWFWDSSPVPPWSRFADRLEATAAGALPATLAFGTVALSGAVLGQGGGALGLLRGGLALAACGCFGLLAGVTLAHVGGAALPVGRLRRVSLLALGILTFFGAVMLRRLGLERMVTEEGAAELLERARAAGGVGPSGLLHNVAARFVIEGSLDAAALILLWLLGALAVSFLAHRAFYWRARDRGVDTSPRGLGPDSVGRRILEQVVAALPSRWRPLLKKDALAFVRDPAQWSQLVLLVGVGGVYLVNCQALAAGFEHLFARDLVLTAVHVGVVTFIAAGLSARFAFTQLALDGPAAWILDAAPLTASDLVRAKWVGSLPVVAGFPVAVGTLGAMVLDVSAFAAASSLVVIAGVSTSLAALGVGRGAIEPAYDAPTVSEMAMGPGALSTMGTAVVLCGLAGFGSLVGLSLVRWGQSPVAYAFALQAVLAPVAVAAFFGWRAVYAGEQAIARRREDGVLLRTGPSTR